MNYIRRIFRRLPIKSRMILSLTFILATAFIITNYMNYTSSHNSVRENIISSVLPLTRDNIYSEIQTNLIRPIFISSLMANDTFLKDWTINGERGTATIRKYLGTIKDKYGFISVFFVSEKSGRYYHYKGILKTISPSDSHDVWYYNFKNLNKEYDLDVDTNEAEENRLTVFINHRLLNYRGELLGVTGVGLNMDSIAEMLKSYNRIYGCNIYLVDKTGEIQIHSDEKYIERINIRNQPEFKRISDRILSGTENSSMYEFERDGRHILLTTRFIPEFDWFLFVEIDEESRMTGILASIKANIIFGFIVSCVIISIAIVTVNYFQSRICRMAVTDELTGAYNRKELHLQFRKAASGFHRNSTPFSVIIFDMDNFKDINDNMGHLYGDDVLKTLSEVVKKNLRLTDILVRWGGDEFMILTYSGLTQAVEAADRIRNLVSGTDLDSCINRGRVSGRRITISCGVAGFTRDDTMDTVISRADAALYRAKSMGRNRVES